MSTPSANNSFDNAFGDVFSTLFPLLMNMNSQSRSQPPVDDLFSTLLRMPNQTQTQNTTTQNTTQNTTIHTTVDIDTLEPLFLQIAPIVIKELFKLNPKIKDIVRKVLTEVDNAPNTTASNTTITKETEITETAVSSKEDVPIESEVYFKADSQGKVSSTSSVVVSKEQNTHYPVIDAKGQTIPLYYQDVFVHCLTNPEMYPEVKDHGWDEMEDTLNYVMNKAKSHGWDEMEDTLDMLNYVMNKYK